MTTYRNIHGRAIQSLATDPTESVAEGQIWYNTSSDTFKSVVATEATSSAAPLITARAMCAGGGIQTAAFLCGGSTGAPTSGTTHTENYNGSGWATSASMSNPRAHFGATGTQTAGIAAGGGPPFAPSPGGAQSNTEEYDGEAWSGGGALPQGIWTNGMFGTQTAGVSVGSEPNGTNYVFEYDGSSWTAGGTMNAIRSYVGTAGTLTAGIVFAGLGPPPNVSDMIATELYDGTNWTTAPNLNTGNTYSPFCGGSQSAAIKAGGIKSSPSGTSNVIERYDGSAWSTSPATLATARGYSKGQSQNSPSNTAALFAGGTTAVPAASAVSTTEEFNFSANVITSAAWSSGANYPTALNQLGGSGTQTAGLGFGGNTSAGNPNGSNVTAEYDGSSWTAGGNLTQNKNTGSRSGVGIQTATMAINFRNDGSPSVSPVNYIAMANVEEYNGSSWTNGTNTPDGEVEAGTCGTISAALRFGGNPGNPPAGPATNSTMYWNDSSWTSLNNMSTSRYGLAPAFQGTYNAALGFGGQTPAPANVTSTEEFDGTNWTAGGNLNTAVFRGSGSGTQTAALSFGGSPSVALAEGYDGTAWSTRPSLANGRGFGGGSGSSTAALYIAGDTTTHVEEFTGETTSVNVKTLTQS